MSDSYQFQVQYVDDTDPFNVMASIRHAEPTVNKKFTFSKSVPLEDQLGAIKKLLRAPHKVRLVAAFRGKLHISSRIRTLDGHEETLISSPLSLLDQCCCTVF